MKFSTLTLISGISMTVAFFGTVNADLRAGAFVLFLFAFFAIAADGFLEYTKVIAQGAYGKGILSSVSPSLILGSLVFVAGLFGIFVGV